MESTPKPAAFFVRVQDLAPCHEDHFVVLFDILKNLAEITNTMGHSG